VHEFKCHAVVVYFFTVPKLRCDFCVFQIFSYVLNNIALVGYSDLFNKGTADYAIDIMSTVCNVISARRLLF
jgi:hypothetical protein